MTPDIFLHHQRSRPTRVLLAVTDLPRSLAFYENVLGLGVVETNGGRALLGAGGRIFLELHERPGATRRRDAAGLFHFALLLPGREALGAAVDRLAHNEKPLTGAADHVVSEAVYLDDPDGHGIELYRDRPSSAWYRNGKLVLDNARLDLEDLRRNADPASASALPAETILGHVHLEVLDIASAAAFYQRELGLQVMASRPEASFLGWNGYHHHMAVNCWNRKTARAGDKGSIGLMAVEIERESLPSPLVINDSSGIELRMILAVTDS